jgi:adenosylcobinamide-GDP ribazoletransferase
MRRAVQQLLFAYGFLTVIPGLGRLSVPPAETGRSTGFYPVVGYTIGLFYYLIGLLDRLSPITVSVILCVFTIAFTRGLHADGLLDTFDGFLSGHREPDRILAVMRDSRVGALGIVAGFSVYLLKIVFFYEILRSHGAGVPPFLAAVPALARGGVPLAGYLYPSAGGKRGLGESFTGSIGLPQVLLSLFFMLLSGLFPGHARLLPAVAAVCAFWVLWGLFCRRKIGGLTGDTMGAGIELSELAALVAMYALSFSF